MPKIAALGGMSSRGFGEFAQQTAANYIEDVFSTYLYTGNGSTQTITNGIDLAGKGGMVWIKNRATVDNHSLQDTSGGPYNRLESNTTAAYSYNTTSNVTAFNSNGFSVGTAARVNGSGNSIASWTFRKAPKFFDVVTWTGNGANRTISHNLGAVPGMIIVKRTDTTAAWAVYHRSLANTEYLVLNTTAAKATGATYWNSTTPTSTVFSLGTSTDVNANGGTYVAYLFAHDAGGFGADGSQNVISCGGASWSGSTDNFVSLGYEPQYVLFKRTDSTANWFVYDIMRGMSYGSSEYLRPNLSDSAGTYNSPYAITPNATGFTVPSGLVSTGTYIYMAIRRGPMRTPTSGTSVYYGGSIPAASTTTWSAPITTDMVIPAERAGASYNFYLSDRLRGSVYSATTATAAEAAASLAFDVQTGARTTGPWYTAGNIAWFFRRAPSFFDVVCYTGTGASLIVNHNLNVKPELIIFKARNLVRKWGVAVPNYQAGNFSSGILNQTDAFSGAYYGISYFDAAPTSTTMTLTSNLDVNNSGSTYVSYLFASCPGVSKVGSYTGTGATQTISCGFTGGARYVLIKRTDSTGDWWVWDTARGMVSGTDPRLAYNSTAAETNANWVYTTTGGFQIVTSDATVNANGGTYLFFAVA